MQTAVEPPYFKNRGWLSWFRDSEFFFLVLTGPAIVEASTLDLEIAPTFLLILLLSLARPFSLCIFSDCRFCVLSFSTLFVVSTFSSHSAIFPLVHFEDDRQLAFYHTLSASCQPLFFKIY